VQQQQRQQQQCPYGPPLSRACSSSSPCLPHPSTVVRLHGWRQSGMHACSPGETGRSGGGRAGGCHCATGGAVALRLAAVGCECRWMQWAGGLRVSKGRQWQQHPGGEHAPAICTAARKGGGSEASRPTVPADHCGAGDAQPRVASRCATATRVGRAGRVPRSAFRSIAIALKRPRTFFRLSQTHSQKVKKA